MSTDNNSDSCDKTHIENKTERCVPIQMLPAILQTSVALTFIYCRCEPYKMSSSLPSSALLMPHFLKDFTILSLLTARNFSPTRKH